MFWELGTTKVGSPEANIPQDIQLVGAHIANDHCVFENTDGKRETFDEKTL